MNSRDPPSKILLLVITHLAHSFPLTNDYLFNIFKKYGSIKKILIFERGKANKAFVEYYDVKHSIAARQDMLGKSIANTGDRLQIHFSRLKSLDLEVVDHSRGTDYTYVHAHTEEPQLQKTNSQKSSPTYHSQSDLRNVEIEGLLDSDSDEEFSYGIQEILSQKPSRMLYVGNIDERITSRMIYNVFNRFGNVEALLYRKKTKSALIQFENINHANIAKEILNNVMFFNSQIRVLYHPAEILQPTTQFDEYIMSNGTKHKIGLLTKTVVFYGMHDFIELQEMIRLVGKIQEIKLEYQSIKITMADVFEVLKVIAVFSEYEYKGQKIKLEIKQ